MRYRSCPAAVFMLLLPGCGNPVDSFPNRTLLRTIGEGRATATVFPALIRQADTTYEDVSATRIAEFLNVEKLAKAEVATEHVPIAGEWRTNDSRMFRESAAALGEYVKTHAMSTDYAILPEYRIGSGGEPVGIHAYVVDRQGRLAAGIGLNSHHKQFSNAPPRTVEDCTRILIDGLRIELKRKPPREFKGVS